MKLHLDNAEGIHLVNAYDGDGIVISQERYRTSLILSPQRLTAPWLLRDVSAIEQHHCAEIADHQGEVILLGTGRDHVVTDPVWMAWFGQRGMGLEVMDTRAACRTYNILASEGRRVVAALIID